MGSRNFRPVRAPRVLIPMGDGVSAYEAGQLWHLLDTRIGLPVTKVDVTDLGSIDWSAYNVLVLASGAGGVFASDEVEQLKSWVRRGGTLIAQRTSAAWAARNGFTPNIDAPGMGAPAGEEASAAEPGRLNYADADEFSGAQAIGGSIWQADVDTTHPLGFGYRRRFLPVWWDHNMFFASSRNAFGTVAMLAEDDPHLSGYISQRNRERLEGSPSVLADQLDSGAVILLIDNTNFRGYWRGTNRLFLNALYFGNHVEVP